MKVKEFKTIWMKIKAPTDRKIINAARKYGLYDDVSNIMEFTGLSRQQSLEFGAKEK